MRRLRLVAITAPDAFPNEAAAINRLLASGVLWRLHIRKPGWSAGRTSSLLSAIDPSVRHLISIHDHHGLASEYGLGGVHLNSRNPIAPAGWQGIVSQSCHSIARAAASETDYCFLSPVFDSISKPGYKGAFSRVELLDAHSVLSHNVLALGGVAPCNLSEITRLGFCGAAMLGAVWPDVDLFIANIKRL